MILRCCIKFEEELLRVPTYCGLQMSHLRISFDLSDFYTKNISVIWSLNIRKESLCIEMGNLFPPMKKHTKNREEFLKHIITYIDNIFIYIRYSHGLNKITSFVYTANIAVNNAGKLWSIVNGQSTVKPDVLLRKWQLQQERKEM